MDISFRVKNEKFNFRVGAIFLQSGKILAMQDECTPYFYLPGGRVKLGETAEDAVAREIKEELGVTAKIVRPLWLNQGFFKEDVDGLQYHEICIYFLMEFSDPELLPKGNEFSRREGIHQHRFVWLNQEQLQQEYFYPVFLKKKIYDCPGRLPCKRNMSNILAGERCDTAFCAVI